MHNSSPLVSVSMPVFNGEAFLEEAIQSILGQTLGDLELIVTDNASTDRTREICEDFLQRDPRVRYFRSSRNFGAARNFNWGYSLSRGKYFKWAASDDICAPTFLEECVKVVEARKDVILCYPREVDIDSRGNFVRETRYRFDTSLRRPEERFGAVIGINRGSPPIFGVMRKADLADTDLIGGYDASDQVLLAHLALKGNYAEVPRDLFLHREHEKRSVRACPTRATATVWFDTGKAGRIVLPEWRIFYEYLRVIQRVPLDLRQRTICWLHLARWVKRKKRYVRMFTDIGNAVERAWGHAAQPGIDVG